MCRSTVFYLYLYASGFVRGELINPLEAMCRLQVKWKIHKGRSSCSICRFVLYCKIATSPSAPSRFQRLIRGLLPTLWLTTNPWLFLKKEFEENSCVILTLDTKSIRASFNVHFLCVQGEFSGFKCVVLYFFPWPGEERVNLIKEQFP